MPPDRVVLEAFGARVRELRTARGWTQEDLARHADLAVVQISRIERGMREVRLTTILKLILALNISPNELLADIG